MFGIDVERCHDLLARCAAFDDYSATRSRANGSIHALHHADSFGLNCSVNSAAIEEHQRDNVIAKEFPREGSVLTTRLLRAASAARGIGSRMR